MPNRPNRSAADPVAVVTRAAGQDGGFLVQRLVHEGFPGLDPFLRDLLDDPPGDPPGDPL